jgi:coenzyme Q-binding protein COQ10
LRQSLTRRLPYTPDQLFALVGDVERYPEFLPWVTAMRTWNRRSAGEMAEAFDAEAKVRFAIVRESFSTEVRLDHAALAIDTRLITGPFRRLENHWLFRPDAVGAEVDFAIDFEFRSRVLEKLAKANAGRAIQRLMACFEARARTLYGSKRTGYCKEM